MVVDLSESDIARRLERLFHRGDVRLVVLFGSRAKGQGRPSSDVDLGVLLEGRSVQAFEEEATRLLGVDRLDLVDLATASPLLAMAVAREGRVLHEGSIGAFAAFASLALRRYNDTAKLRRQREEGLRSLLAARGL